MKKTSLDYGIWIDEHAQLTIARQCGDLEGFDGKSIRSRQFVSPSAAARHVERVLPGAVWAVLDQYVRSDVVAWGVVGATGAELDRLLHEGYTGPRTRMSDAERMRWQPRMDDAQDEDLPSAV
jgi:hypothetical protein